MTNDQVKILMSLLTKEGLFQQEAAEALVHALIDIKESINKIYDQILPHLLKEHHHLTKEQVLDELWEIRDHFRHIDYHIKDANITDL